MRRAGALLFVLLCFLPAASFAQADDAGLLQARQLYSQKKFSAAADILTKLDKAGKLKPADLVILGICDTELGLLDEASTALEKSAMQEPRSPALQGARANLAFARKQWGEAYKLFSAANAQDPGASQYKDGMVASLVNQGVAQFGQGKAADARTSFLAALDIDPGSTPARRNLAILMLQGGDSAGAATELEKVIAASPDDAQALRYLFLARDRLGDTAAELAALNRLAVLQPADPEVWAVMARLLESAGNKDAAAAAFRNAVDRGSQDPLPYYRIGAATRDRYMLHDAIGKAVQLSGALQLQAAQAAQKASGKEDMAGLRLLTVQAGEVRATLGSAVTLLREIDGDVLFEQDLVRLQSWYPGSVELLSALGRYYADKARWTDALSAWRKVLQDHPLDADAQAGAGHALEKLGDGAQAILAIRRALDITPIAPELYADLERLYADDKAGLRQDFLDRTYRDTRNALLFRELAKVEAGMGLASDAEAHNARAAVIEAGK
jgi:tetratricopeptide (TPR) repeat protein